MPQDSLSCFERETCNIESIFLFCWPVLVSSRWSVANKQHSTSTLFTWPWRASGLNLLSHRLKPQFDQVWRPFANKSSSVSRRGLTPRPSLLLLYPLTMLLSRLWPQQSEPMWHLLWASRWQFCMTTHYTFPRFTSTTQNTDQRATFSCIKSERTPRHHAWH